MKMADYLWFDTKYKNNPIQNLEDTVKITRQFFNERGIKFTDRTNENIEKALKELIFELGRKFTPSKFALARELLLCYAPLLEIDDKTYKEYIKKFIKASQDFYNYNPCKNCPHEIG